LWTQRKKIHRVPIKKKRFYVNQPARHSIQMLDQFSESDINKWRQALDENESYWIRLFYHLESLRNLRQGEIRDSLQRIPPVQQKINNWCRIVDYKYSLNPLSCAGSLKNGGRFNIGTDINSGVFRPFPALYIAENEVTAYMERFGAMPSQRTGTLTGEEFALRKKSSFTTVFLRGDIFNLFDLNKTSNLRYFVDIIKSFDMPDELQSLAKSIGISPPWLVTKPSALKQVLLDPSWRQWPKLYDIPSNSQIFARLVSDAGFEGIVYSSVKGPNNCIVLFPENFNNSESFLGIMDEHPPQVSIPRLDKNTCRELISL